MTTKNKVEEAGAVGVFLIKEIFQLFDKHPNRSFNHKQVGKELRSAFVDFVANSPDLNNASEDPYELLGNHPGIVSIG
jgi:hypothetical protein